MTTVPFTALQAVNPSAIIELYEIALDSTLHGSTDILRFHNGTSLVRNGDIKFASNTYTKFPIECKGFEYTAKGQFPRPTITVSNASGFITATLLGITGIAKDLVGAKFTRIRTLAKFIDDDNFPSGTNPSGAVNTSTKFPDEIYFIDRKMTENREVIQWEAASALDLTNVKIPKRITGIELFPSIGKYVG